jgi:hypothetical protein
MACGIPHAEVKERFCYDVFMKIQTQYTYEKKWTDTKEDDLLKIIEEEVGDADPKGTLSYVKEAIQKGKVITVGNCRFREKHVEGQ